MVERTSRDRGEDNTNLALLTDGLRAEREQGITIDVAYRYFATPRRKFIIADTPGHIQYTRNMVTGASTADLAVVLVDARNGLTEQSRRHAFLTTLLRVPHMVLAVNKMDLVDYSAEVFERISEEFSAFAARLDIGDLTFIPISALHGDNVVDRSANMPWYDGPSLLHHLEHVHIASDRNMIDVRFPVQYVIRPHAATDAEPCTTTAAAAGRSGPAACSSRATRCCTCPPVSSHSRAAHRVGGDAGARGVRAHVGDAAARRRRGHLPRRHDLPPEQPSGRGPGHRGDGLLDVVRGGAGTAPSAGRQAHLADEVEGDRHPDLHYRIDVNTLHRDESAAQLGPERDRPGQAPRSPQAHLL